MNYKILFCGRICSTFDSILKLIIETCREADYVVNTTAFEKHAPIANAAFEIELIGSAKKEPVSIVIDFEDIFCGQCDIVINSVVTAMPQDSNQKHYWGLVASLFKIVPDLSPAFITSYLLDKKMDAELTLYKQYLSTSLPLKIQDILK